MSYRRPRYGGWYWSPPPPPAVLPIHSEDAWTKHWQSHKGSNKLMVIGFSASWCEACSFMEPAFKALKAKYADVVFVKIDVDELPVVAQQWKVEAMPTIVLVKGGEQAGRVEGEKKDELEWKVEKLMRD